MKIEYKDYLQTGLGEIAVGDEHSSDADEQREPASSAAVVARGWGG
jgi:hypothetical protein